jgi:hypothetical protein
MLEDGVVRHKQFTNGTARAGAAKYFAEHLSVSQVHGLSKQEIDLEVFAALEKNLHPETGERLTPRTNGS